MAVAAGTGAGAKAAEAVAVVGAKAVYAEARHVRWLVQCGGGGNCSCDSSGCWLGLRQRLLGFRQRWLS